MNSFNKWWVEEFDPPTSEEYVAAQAAWDKALDDVSAIVKSYGEYPYDVVILEKIEGMRT